MKTCKMFECNRPATVEIEVASEDEDSDERETLAVCRQCLNSLVERGEAAEEILHDVIDQLEDLSLADGASPELKKLYEAAVADAADAGILITDEAAEEPAEEEEAEEAEEDVEEATEEEKPEYPN